MALEGHPRQGIARPAAIGSHILGFDVHHDAAVGIALVAGVLAHAVGHHPPLLGGGAHHQAARAHAEAVHTAAVAGVVDELVFSRPQ